MHSRDAKPLAVLGINWEIQDADESVHSTDASPGSDSGLTGPLIREIDEVAKNRPGEAANR